MLKFILTFLYTSTKKKNKETVRIDLIMGKKCLIV